ncbi:hypothetical protein JHK87_006034 [Glycine soja]|nr:hypothetical protein JHK87_006034 [Glycine soja]
MALSDISSPTSCPDEKESDCDSPIESNAFGDLSLTKEKTFDLQTVSPHSFGQGLPYAPEGWPNPGDVLGWKVLKRTSHAGDGASEPSFMFSNTLNQIFLTWELKHSLIYLAGRSRYWENSQKSQLTQKFSRLLHLRQCLAPNQDANIVIDFCDQNDKETRIDSTEISKGISDSEEGSAMQTTVKKDPNATTVLENLDEDLDTLENVTVEPHTET